MAPMTSRSDSYLNPAPHLGPPSLSFMRKTRYWVRRWALLGTSSTLVLAPSAGADGNADADSSASGTYTLDPHVVTTTRLPRNVEQIPYSIDEVSFDDLAPRESGVSIDESLRRLPGLFVSNRQNLSQGDRLSIRGIGSRTSFGVRGVRVLLDHIPLTMPDGQSQLSNVDLSSIGRIDVMRGATSALYGNAAGGVVHLHTRDPGARGGTMEIEPRLVLGSYGLAKWQIGLSRGFEDHALVVSANRLERDGYRDHAESRSMNLNAVGRHRIGKHLRATTVLNFYDAPYLLNPSSLALADANTTPRMARFFVRSQGATKQVRQLQGGATVDYNQPEFGRLLVTAYGLTRSLSNPIPGRIIELERSAGGLRSAFSPTRIGSLPIQAILGIDLEAQSDDRQEFANGGLPELVGTLDADDVLDQVIYGDRQLDQQERVVGIGPFYELQWTTLGSVTFTTGGRYDRYRFAADGIDRSGNRTLSRFSPMVGATFNPHRQLTLFANYTTAFQTPSTVELGNSASSEGGFNDDLDPETIHSVELGARGAFPVSSRPLDFGISLYCFEIDDILVPFQLADSEEVFFRNERRATNLGLELTASWAPTRTIRTDFSYTMSSFEYGSFDECIGGIEGGVAEECHTHENNDVPGMPQNHGFARLAYDRTGSASDAVGGGDVARGVFASLDLRWVGEYFANDLNGPAAGSDKPVSDFLNPSHWTSDLRLGTRGALAGIPFQLTIGIDNLFDERYNGSVVPNAFSDRFFEPAPGRTFFLSLSLPYSRTS